MFEDGDILKGRYGLLRTRRGGLWYNEMSSLRGWTDESVLNIIKLNASNTFPPAAPPKAGKISKTKPVPPPSFRYDFWVERAGQKVDITL